MNKHFYYSKKVLIILSAVMLTFTSCKDFFDPEQELNITEDQMYNDWYEFRSIEMGMYALQQNLVEQLVVLGELRGDLLTITPNADADLVEIYNYNISKDNKYASPVNFFKLIAASNNFIRVLQREHPEVLDEESEITNYDRLYGEALCMRAWTYFNAAKIYGKIPFIHESLVTMEEIENYVNSEGTYIDSVNIVFGRDGFNNDTTRNIEPIVLEKNYFDLDMVIDHFTNELENKIKAVGVKHDIDREDPTWEISIWNTYALHALLGQMYLTYGDLNRAANHFEVIINANTSTNRYQLTNSFAFGNWNQIFTELDNQEHIFTVWFDKNRFQQNELQNLFLPIPPYQYMLKPTKVAIDNWETSWFNQRINRNTNPARSSMAFPGIPGDLYRGYGTSYLYLRNSNTVITVMEDIQGMLEYKRLGDTRTVNNMMDGMDTVAMKYYSGMYEDDAFFIIYRAGNIHLYLSEIYNYWLHYVRPTGGGDPTLRTELNKAMGLINYGEYYTISLSRIQRGVRGRVGYSGADDALTYDDIQYIHDPITNEITGYISLGTNLLRKQQIFENNLLNERARELAFEGERFYDLMRIAKRRNDPSILASRVSQKFPAGKREQMYEYLMDENNWYIHMFD
jgi:starch-binding outer membrane protein, SusD/RagB family